METKEKNNLINNLLECIGEAIDLDSDDGEKEDILIGLIDICKSATYLPTKERKRQWIKPWRETRAERGSYSFLTRELLLSDEPSYRNYLRVSKQQFEFLLNLVDRDIRRSDTCMRDAISPAEKLSICLRFLATGESFRSLDFQTRVSRSAISNIVTEVCNALWKRLKGPYLKFPSNPSEWEAISKEFAIKWQFPNCLGALDGKHITFRPLRKDGAFYHNYKGTNSIVLLALVDANYKFIYVNIGCNGRSNDAGVFLQSHLSKVLEEDTIPPNAVVGNGRCLPYVIIGDDAFPMQTHLMKPYPYHTNSKEKQIFNIRLSRARQVVEHAFGMLSNRFRIFLSPINLRVQTVESITFASCALHNFLLENDSTYIQSIGNISPENNKNSSRINNPRKGTAEAIRQEFTAYFNNEGKLDWI